ncbi:dihydroorotase [Acidihalobacter ferrooxydans]|uniref:Dihydroorotase n=2 Tax=Acidihalobacter ferrooxydans TaxID=1765967 RepID=A0A1P8UKX5_9GAMM|nr:dihydroorotase [Acidihalobacter ferrooxydans]
MQHGTHPCAAEGATSRLLIRQGHVIDPANGIDRVADLAIADGCIVGLDPQAFQADETLDARGLLVIPGLVDLAVRLREPGAEHKGTVASECRAAVAAGITTICAQPDTAPPIDTPADVRLLHQKATAAGRARVVVLGALTRALDGEHLTDMAALAEAGCIGVSNAQRPVPDLLVLRRALEYASGLGLSVHAQPMDATLTRGGCAHEGPIATRLGLAAIPIAAETAALGQWLALVEQTGARVHFGRLSSAVGVRMLARAIADGLPVSGDVAAHQLFLSEMDIADFNPQCHVLPPLRSQRDQAALRAALADGTLTAVCSDHQPHEIDAKLAPFAETRPGISGLETLLALTLRLADEGVLTLREAIARVTAAPARILGVPAGTLSAGAPADLCLLDPDAEWELDADRLHSRGHNTPFHGWPLRGRVRRTLRGGHTVYLADEDPSA